MLVIPIQIIICYISLFPISFPLYFPPDRLSNPKMKDDLRRSSSPSPPLHRHEHRLHHHHHHRLHAVNITGTPTSPSKLKSFSFSDLKMATRNFRPDSVLGKGGFGSVFKGWVDEQSYVATKPLIGIVIDVKKLN